MQARVLDASSELFAQHRGETNATVSHSGVNRILLAAAYIFRIAQRYAAINLLTLIGDYPSIDLMNT
jgi:broad specificity phosphatase PhoE